jgi:hypothetical protein
MCEFAAVFGVKEDGFPTLRNEPWCLEVTFMDYISKLMDCRLSNLLFLASEGLLKAMDRDPYKHMKKIATR